MSTYNLTFSKIRLKMESDKEHCLYQKKNADVHRIIYKMYSENITAKKYVRSDLNDLKTVISISVTKNAPDALRLWKRTNCGKSRGK